MFDFLLPHLHWFVAFAGLGLLVALEQGLIKLAKRYLPRGSKMRRAVLWSRANEPD
jgi:hypothetical protein